MTHHDQCVDQIWSAFIVWQYRNHTYTTHPPSSMCGPNMVSFHCMAIQEPKIHYTPSIVNMWTKQGQLSLYGNIEPPHTLHTLHRQCVDQTWPAFIVWQYRNHTYTTHPPSSMCGPNMVSLHCMAIQKPHIHYTPFIINVWTKYGQPSLYGYIETTHTLHTPHHQCVDQIWSALSFIVWQYRNHTYITRPPSSMCGPDMVNLHCMAIQKPHIHCTPSIVNVCTTYGQLSLYGNIETTHTLHTLHHQCVDQVWPAFNV